MDCCTINPLLCTQPLQEADKYFCKKTLKLNGKHFSFPCGAEHQVGDSIIFVHKKKVVIVCHTR